MKIIITGCPLIEDNVAKMLNPGEELQGIDIPLGKWGSNGCLSWSLAIPPGGNKLLPGEFSDFPLKNESTQEDYYIHYVSDPFYTLPVLTRLDKKVIDIMINIIKKFFNMDVNNFKGADKYGLLFLFWNKLVQNQNPDLVFKVEDPTDFSKFIKEKLGQSINTEPFTPAMGTDGSIFPADPNILYGLDQFCTLYKYPLLSIRIVNTHQKNENGTNNPFNRMARMAPLMPPASQGARTTGNRPSQNTASQGGGVTINNRLVHNVYKISGANEIVEKKKASFGVKKKY